MDLTCPSGEEPLVSSLNVTLLLKGRMVSFGSAFLSLEIALRGSLETVMFGCRLAMLEDRETVVGDSDSFSCCLPDCDVPLNLRSVAGIPSFGNIEAKNPIVGSNEMRGGVDSSTDTFFLVTDSTRSLLLYELKD